MNRQPALSAVILVLLLVPLLHACQSNGEDLAATREKILQGLQQLLNQPFVGRYEYTISGTENLQAEAEGRSGWAKVSREGFVTEEVEVGSRRRRVRGANHLYIFRATADTGTDDYSLAQLLTLRKATPYDLTFNRHLKKIHERRMLPHMFMAFDWLQIIASSQTALTAVEPATWNGEPAIRVAFRTERSEGGANAHAIFDGWLPGVDPGQVLLLPNSNYLPVEWILELTLAADDRAHIETTASYNFDHRPALCTELVQRRTIGGEVDTLRSVYTYQSFEEPEPGDFRVTAFGINEPEEVRSQRSFWPFIWLIVGVVSIILAVIGRHFALRS